MSAQRGKKFEGLNLEPVATAQKRSLRSQTSGQLSEPTIEGNPGDNIEEQVKLTAEGLPEDWIKEVKPQRNGSSRKNTFYVDPKSGYAFPSLEDALRYVQTGSILSCAVIPQKRSREELLILMNSSETKSTPRQTVKTQTVMSSAQVTYQAKLGSDGLPVDWIKEVKTRKKDSSRKDVFYIDPKTGYAFFSLKDALRYVETGDILSCASRPQKRSMEEIRILSSQTIKTESAASPAQPSNFIDDGISGDNVCKVVQENQLTSHGLPKNWIKELKPRKNGTKVDPFYIDPDTGYAFLSLKDALRYVATGNVLSCVMRPRKRSIEEVQALISSSEMSSISGMKAVQRESSQPVLLNTSHRKRKRSPVKSSALKPEEDLNIKGTDNATGTASRRVKQRIEGPLSVRASPRLSIKAENDAENNESCSTLPGMSNSSAHPDAKTEEVAMVENGSSTRTPLRNGKLRKETLMPHRVSPRLAAPETTDITSVETKNSLTSKNRRLRSQPNLENKEETIEGASAGSTGKLLRSGKMRRERPTLPLRGSSRLAALTATTDGPNEPDLELKEETIEGIKGSSIKETTRRRGKMHREKQASIRASPRLAAHTDTTYVENDNTMMSQHDLELKETTIEGANSGSTETPIRRGKMRRERGTPLRASSRLATQNMINDATSVQNENSTMSNALFGPTSQPDLERKEVTVERANISSTGTPLRRGKMRRDRRGTSLRASSQVATHNMTNDATTVQNENSTMSNALFGPTSQPDLEHKEETVEGTKGSSTKGTTRRRGKMHRERRGTPVRASSRLATPTMTNDATSVQNENSTMSNNLFGPTSQPDLERKEETVGRANISSTGTPSLRRGKMRRERPTPLREEALFGPTSQPDLELKEETVEGANISSTETPLRRGKMRRERPTPLRASSHLTTLDVTNNATSVENENSTMSNDLFGPTSQPDLERKEETVQGANISSTETPMRRGKMRRERPTPLRASTRLAAPDATNNATPVEIDNSAAINALFEPSSPSLSFLNVGPTGQPDLELQEERIEGENDSSPGTPLYNTRPFRASSCQAALKATTDCTSEKNEDNIGSNAFSVPPPLHPDLNLESSLADLQLEEVITGANGNKSESTMGPAADENHQENNKTSNAMSELPFSPARPDLNLGPTNQPYWEPKVETIAAANGSAIRTTTSQRVEPRREVPTRVKTSPCLEALKATTEAASRNTNEKNRMTSSALSQLSHFPGRPDLNLGPTSQLTVKRQEEMSRANGSSTGRPTPPVNAMTEAASYYNYGNNIKISNYFCVPVESPTSKIIMGSTGQPNPREIWFDTTAAAPSTPISEVKRAPDLNMVPMSWPEPNVVPKLEQQQPAVNTISEFNMQPPVPSEILYQDPTMDALLSAQEAGPSMPPHMSIDALNSPLSPFFGDFWHDPCLSYAFNTLTGGMDQQRTTGLSAGPENNVNWAGARNGGPPVENPSIGPSQPTTQTPQYMNNGMPFPK
ncbi:Methyl-CpG-binding domain-containing protein 13 [Carex littledalei]|uniref:Methyl-CpG-binding domain-containing protein 13 n=1 Tax=Carex littledalei TaxID=544730 RepID=A0A833QTX0_9POAL|nr:Methyl-CpG-binding domain-containing protein 13 [Carex littledalei]